MREVLNKIQIKYCVFHIDIKKPLREPVSVKRFAFNKYEILLVLCEAICTILEKIQELDEPLAANGWKLPRMKYCRMFWGNLDRPWCSPIRLFQKPRLFSANGVIGLPYFAWASLLMTTVSEPMRLLLLRVASMTIMILPISQSHGC